MRFSSVAVTVVALFTSGVNAFALTPHAHAFSSSVVRSNVVALGAEKGNDVVENSGKAKEMIDTFRNNMGTRNNDGAKKVCLRRMKRLYRVIP
jgi:hypothetical protein